MLLVQSTDYINILVQVILHQYFTTEECFNVITQDFSKLNFQLNHSFVNYNDRHPNLNNVLFTFACQHFLLQTDKPKTTFELMEHLIRFTPTTKFHTRRYLIYAMNEHSEDIFDSDQLEFVADLVLIKRVGDLVELWTHRYVGREDHRSPILLDQWSIRNASFLYNNNLYPDKLSNQLGRVLRITTFDYKPYVNWDSHSGVELMMALEYAKMFNMTYNLTYEVDYWGVVNDENYTANGAKGTLLTDKADISMGSWYPIPNYTKYFDLTESTVRIGVTFLVPIPKLESGWFTPLFSFSYDLWIGFLFTYLAIIIAYFAYNYVYYKYILDLKINLRNTFQASVEVITFTLFFQQPLKIFLLTKGANLRLLLTIILIISLIFAASYTAGFASILTIPSYERGIRDSKDFEQSGMKWGAVHPALLDSFRDLAQYKHIVSNILILTDEDINSRMSKHDFAMLVDRIPNGIMLGHRVDYQDIQYYRVLEDDLFSSICVMLVKRSSILDPSARRAFLLMKEFGLIYIWELKAYFEENYKAQIALKLRTADKQVVKLHLKHVQGAFGILCLGILASIICFLWEISHTFKGFKTKK